MFAFLKNITVEPPLFLFLVVHDYASFFDSNLFHQKVCRFDQTTEPDLSTRCEDEKRGILFMSEVSSKYQSVVFLLSMLVTIFASFWSDKAGRRRRPLIYIPILGQMFHTLSGCLSSYFWRWTPTVAIIPWVIFESFSGGIFLILAACQVYICDISDAESRTMRLGLLGAVKLISMILGKGAAGYVLHYFGFYHSYLICFALSACGFVLASVLIEDTSVAVEKQIGLCSIFNLKSVLLDSFKVVFGKNLGRRRVTIVMLLIVNVTVVFTYFGELSVLYQYLRYRFGLDEEKYSHYLISKLSGSALGMVFCSVVLSKHFKVHDGVIGILAGFFDIIAISGLLFSNQIWQIYLIPLIDLFHGTAMTVCVSFISKYYSPNELGRLSAVNGVFSLLIPLSFPAYNIIYQQTLDTFPSAFCLLSMVLDIVIVLFYYGSYFCSKKFDAEKPTGALEETCVMIIPGGASERCDAAYHIETHKCYD